MFKEWLREQVLVALDEAQELVGHNQLVPRVILHNDMVLMGAESGAVTSCEILIFAANVNGEVDIETTGYSSMWMKFSRTICDED